MTTSTLPRSKRKAARTRTAEHRPAVRKRINRHDSLTAVDLFSGFGGLTSGIKAAGFDTIMAANHNAYKVEVHEANHPDTEHWIADLIDKDAADYHSARDLPAADLLAAGVSCVNHSQANSERAYEQTADLFSMDDPEYDARVTKSEKDRATANCVLHYAKKNRPKVILVECTTEFTSWGAALPGKTKVGDGSTYRWWLAQLRDLGYDHKVMYLNSQFFGVGQSRDRWYAAFWLARPLTGEVAVPAPDLEHRPETWCENCSCTVPAVWTWRTGIPDTGAVRYGKQYDYRCPQCRREVVPPMTPSVHSIDFTNLGTRIGDKVKPLAAATMARAERCRQRFADFPAVLLPAKAVYGTEKHLWEPMATQTGQQDKALLMAPFAAAVHNFQGAPRGVDEAFPTILGSETLALVTAGVVPFRKNTLPTPQGLPMPTVTSDQIPGVLMAAGRISNNGSIAEAKYRAHPLSDPLGTITSSASQALLFGGWMKQNGSTGTETAPHPFTDPFGTLTGRDTTGLVMAQGAWSASLADIALEDCYFRMMGAHEVGRGCGFDVTFQDQPGTFQVWGSARDQVDGFGNAVSPQVGEWIGGRLRDALHASRIAA